GVFMIRKLLIVVSLILASFAYAESKDDYDNFNSDGQDYENFNSTAEDPYRNWNDVLVLLQKKGVNTNEIEWSEIDSSCMIIKNTSSEFEFNKCKYSNALNYSQYQKDKTYCKAAAEQKYYSFHWLDRPIVMAFW
ncbi:MAG: hypothetical protein K0R98_1581, partial [Rickettsiaceae bacterium]|nr:hypothetical protein [Rickettsiaceae bacterium]